jgi:hypothetical protein
MCSLTQVTESLRKTVTLGTNWQPGARLMLNKNSGPLMIPG